jgi:hypothetical protein
MDDSRELPYYRPHEDDLEPSLDAVLSSPLGMEAGGSAHDGKREELRRAFQSLLDLAGDDRDRLGWIAIQINPPASWGSKQSLPGPQLSQLHEEVERQVLAAERREEERAKRAQSSPVKQQGGAGK